MRAFGVDVEIVRAAPQPGDAPAERSPRPSGGAPIDPAPRASGDAPVDGAVVLDLRADDGSRYLTVTRSPAGWTLDAPAFGRHVVAPDGRRITVGAGDPDGDRLLVAQSLPTAAALQGRDMFHAAAVLTPAGVVALSGPSGSGKSTLAAGLAARGLGTPFTGDVLAVAPMAAGVAAFAGPVDADDPTSVPQPDAGGLAALVLLDRVAEPGEPHVDAPDADRLTRELLAAAFAPHVDPPARLVARLDACGRLLEQARVHRLVIGRGATVDATLDRLSVLLSTARIDAL